MNARKKSIADAGPTRHGALMTSMHQIRVAAALEAIALGHTEVDVDHLLLGLLSAGGPSARLLGAAGMDLRSARTAVVAEDLHRLGALGVSPAPGDAATTTARDMTRAIAVPLSGRARQVMDESAYRSDDRSLLVTLISSGGHRVLGLLERLRVDVDALRASAAEDSPAAGPACRGHARAPEQRSPLPNGFAWNHACYTQVLPTSAATLWDVVVDPVRVGEWQPNYKFVAGEGDRVQYLEDASGRPWARDVLHVLPQRSVTWRLRDASMQAGMHQELQAELEDDGDGGTRLRLSRDWPSRGLSWRLLRPLMTRVVRVQLRALALGLTRATA